MENLELRAKVAEVPLTKGMIAIIDEEDLPLVSKYKWHATKGPYTFYAQTNSTDESGRRIHIKMHRLIMNPEKGYEVDHKNSNGLDNRRSNLRVAIKSLNQANRRISKNSKSGFKGVSWYKPLSRWRAQIRVNWKRLHIGLFDDPETAARAYDDAAIRLFGEYARTNFKQNEGEQRIKEQSKKEEIELVELAKREFIPPRFCHWDVVCQREKTRRLNILKSYLALSATEKSEKKE